MGINDSDFMEELATAVSLAQNGVFTGLDAILRALAGDDEDARLEAARCCECIGFSAAIDPLANMALRDPSPDNRNQAIFALVSIGRPAVVPSLIDALDDADKERRIDARVALYRVLGSDVLQLVSEEERVTERDSRARARVATWWAAQSKRFDPARVYTLGKLAHPGVLIDELSRSQQAIPDAYLDTLHNSTGQDFGTSPPFAELVIKWQDWWANNRAHYEPGRRYFYGHRVP